MSMSDKILSLYRDKSASEQFIEKTKFRKKVGLKSYTKWPISWIKTSFKAYPRFPKIELKMTERERLSTELIKALEERQSSRLFDNKNVSLVELSTLLQYSIGVKYLPADGNWNRHKRYYPSGGARFPLESYILALRVKGLKMGAYHYNVKGHCLEELYIGPIKKKVASFFGEGWITNVGFIVLLTGVFGRTEVKYRSRGLRHILIEAGHVGQNFYLNSASMKLGCCGLGGYVDEKVNKFLDLDGVNESILYAIAIGKIKAITK